jgi:hypothetical protein
VILNGTPAINLSGCGPGVNLFGPAAVAMVE